MALTRKFLSALGIDEEKAEQIITAHTETVEGLKSERDKYKADAEKLPAIEGEYKALKEKVAGEDPYKDKFEALKKDFDAYKKGIEEKETAAKKESAFRALLKEAGIPEKRLDTILKASKEAVSKLEFDDEGKVKEGDKLKEGLKSEWADIIPTTKTEGAKTATPPSNTGKNTMTREQIRAIPDAAERQKAMAENPSLFGLPETSNS